MENTNKASDQLASIRRLKSLKLDESEKDSDVTTNQGGRTWVLVVILIATAVGGYMIGGLELGDGDSNRASEEANNLGAQLYAAPDDTQIADAGGRTVGGTIIANGYVVAGKMATIASEVTGRLIELKVSEGDTVQQGALIAVLDDTLVKAEYEAMASRETSAASAVFVLEEELKDAQQVLDRQERLFEDNLVSESDFLGYRAKVDILNARIEQSRADVETIRRDLSTLAARLERYQIRAPFSGTIVAENANQGEIVSPVSAGGGFTRTGIYTIVDMGSLRIEVQLNESEYDKVFVGQEVVIRFDAFASTAYRGTVSLLAPTVNRNTAAVTVHVALIGDVSRILPNMSAQLEFTQKDAAN